MAHAMDIPFLTSRKPRTSVKPNGAGTVHADDRTPFVKQLRWLIKNPPEHSVVMDVTPAMASTMLELNTSNRPKSRQHTSELAREITRGEWMHTGAPIVFSRDGELLDGQHRLMAVISTGQTIRSDVRFGIDPQAFMKMDQRLKSRGAGDVFAIQGVANYTNASTIARWVWAYENAEMESRAAGVLTAKELYHYYLKHQKIQDSVGFGRAIQRALRCSPTLFGALHYICARKDRALADEFFEKIASGIFSNKRDPAYRLREYLRQPLVGERQHNLSGKRHTAAITIKAWNAVREGRTISAFRWRGDQNPDEAFPKAI